LICKCSIAKSLKYSLTFFVGLKMTSKLGDIFEKVADYYGIFCVYSWYITNWIIRLILKKVTGTLKHKSFFFKYLMSRTKNSNEI